MYKFIFFIIIIFGFFSCKTIQFSDLKPKGAIDNPLLSLEPKIDLGSLQSAYSLGSTSSSGGGSAYGTRGLNNSVIGVASYYGTSTSYADKRIQDAIVIFEREVRNNITNGEEKYLGSAICKITTGETKMKDIVFYTLSLLTLTVPNWLGMPMLSYETELELEVEIKNCNNNTIGRYQGYGIKKTLVAFYYGYSGGGAFQVTGNESAARKSNIDAFKMAMNEIKLKISNDSKKLNNLLSNCK
jgi:hypothetical protein